MDQILLRRCGILPHHMGISHDPVQQGGLGNVSLFSAESIKAPNFLVFGVSHLVTSSDDRCQCSGDASQASLDGSNEDPLANDAIYNAFACK